jgi:Nuclease A inhibitor-like protein
MSQPTAVPASAKRLAKALQTLATGLTLPSESDFPYKAFAAPLDPTIPLTVKNFSVAARLKPEYNEPDLTSAAAFFKQNQTPDAQEPEQIQAYKQLEKVMKATLRKLTVVYARGTDVVEVPFFIFGRTEVGCLVGLKSTAIET